MIEYYDNDFKSYHAEMKLGTVTDTLDIWGTVTGEHPWDMVNEESVIRAFAGYTGVVRQIPPKYSALRINGRRAYDLAREGADFEIKAREITIVSNEITDMDLGTGRIGFDVTCSKGTYIRSICAEIGDALGCGATMTALTRTGSGFFTYSSAVELSELLEMTDEEIDKLIIPVDETLTGLGRIEIDDNRIIAFLNGNESGAPCYTVREPSHFGGRAGGYIYKVYGEGDFLGTGEICEGSLIPRKVYAGR
jgi:tRNA pseudouridine55 synthase